MFYLIIMAILAVTTCEGERSFSMLKLIKTPLRSTMGQENLNGLALMCGHGSITLNINKRFKEYSI